MSDNQPSISGENELTSERLEFFKGYAATALLSSSRSVLIKPSELSFIASELLDRRKDGLGTVSVKPLDDDAIMEVIRECFPWQEQAEILSLLTYEKSVPMFPQATYDVPSYRAERFVRAIEARVKSCLTSIGVEAGK